MRNWSSKAEQQTSGLATEAIDDSSMVMDSLGPATERLAYRNQKEENNTLMGIDEGLR